MMQPAPFRQLPGDTLRPAEAYWLRAEDDIRLRIAHWRPEGGDRRGTVLLLPGRTEYIEKYSESAAGLTAQGYDVLSIDWRGQGLSDRLQTNPRLGHVNDFADYQLDLVEMVVAATDLGLPQPWHLLGHSMGGCIGLAGLHAGLDVRTAVFSAPMWGINLRQMPHGVAVGLAYLAGRFGRGANAAPGSGASGNYFLNEAFETNLLTEDVDQWSRLLKQAVAWPDMTIGGASLAWVRNALNECARLSQLESPAIPAMIALGSREKVVSSTAIRDRAARWKGATLLEVDGARHEIMMCLPERRAEFMNAALWQFEQV